MSDFDLALQRAEARVGQVLHGKWKLDRVLGVGGMAAVYAATHRNGKRGAVKLLHPELCNSSESRARFLREGYVANTVAHPGAVSVLDDDVAEDGSVFLVMELLEGSTVDAVLEQRPARALEVREVLDIADDLLDVLAAAHDKGIVHRDLKPENLFLTADGTLKVLDFGIARLRQNTTSATTTRTGDSMGTPAFMPPEQALGDWDSVDGRTDLWSVGATMFTLLTGRFVHDAENVQKMMLSAMTKPSQPLLSIAPHLPQHLGIVVDRALMQKPAERFEDARAMQRAVRELKAGGLSMATTIVSHGGTDGGAALPRVPSGGAHVMTAAPVSSDRSKAAPAHSGRGLALAVAIGGSALCAGAFVALKIALPNAKPATAQSSLRSAEAEAVASESASIAVVFLSPSASSTELAAPPTSAPPASAQSSALPSASLSAPPTTSAGRPPPRAAPPPPPRPATTTFNGRF